MFLLQPLMRSSLPSFMCLCVFLVMLVVVGGEGADPNGYLLYCPCMGRFGNQMDQFLGAISFSKSLNRTLILPPIIEYSERSGDARMVEFSAYFEVETLQSFHKVITANQFFRHYAALWPSHQRKVLCWAPRRGIYDQSKFGCMATEGSPFEPFWRHLGVEFVGDLYYGKTIGDTDFTKPSIIAKWQENYSASKFPVLVFSSAPAQFPVVEAHRFIQKYLKWSASAIKEAQKFHVSQLRRPYIGIHLRTDHDWDAVCESVDEKHTIKLFASAQCTGYANEYGMVSKEMCSPSLNTILDEIEQRVNALSAVSVFVSSDKLFYIDEITERLKANKVSVVKLQRNNLRTSLVLLGMADHFIGNCVSTFSAFVARQREFQQNGASTSFFGAPIPTTNKPNNEEL